MNDWRFVECTCGREGWMIIATHLDTCPRKRAWAQQPLTFRSQMALAISAHRNREVDFLIALEKFTNAGLNLLDVWKDDFTGFDAGTLPTFLGEMTPEIFEEFLNDLSYFAKYPDWKAKK